MATKKEIQETWEKATAIRGKSTETWRRDKEGNKIRFASYGTVGEFGWEIDHKKPQSKGGSDSPKNLQPLHWQENREKSDKYSG